MNQWYAIIIIYYLKSYTIQQLNQQSSEWESIQLNADHKQKYTIQKEGILMSEIFFEGREKVGNTLIEIILMT